MTLFAEFIPGESGRLFVLRVEPTTTCQGTVLHIPAFAEEMHKARRQVSLQARALAAQGWRVVVPDLYGSGDSEGDFADADWHLWQRDLLSLIHHFSAPDPPVLWGLRLGALLATTLLEHSSVRGLVLWQPVLQGAQFLRQFLRLRLAAGMLSGSRESLASLQAMLQQQGSVEVAGYTLSRALATALETAQLQPPIRPLPTLWCEILSPEQALSPARQQRQDAWPGAATGTLRIATLTAKPFWQTQEIYQCPALVEHTCEFIAQLEPAPCV